MPLRWSALFCAACLSVATFGDDAADLQFKVARLLIAMESPKAANYAANRATLQDLLTKNPMLANERLPASRLGLSSELPLYYSARNLDLAKLLLEKGANPKLTDSSGNAALHWAVHFALPEWTKLLLSHGANPRATNAEGMTALHLHHCTSPETYALFIKLGANPNARTSRDAYFGSEQTPLHYAVWHRREGVVRMALKLKDMPRLNIDSRTSEGYTPLLIAAKMGEIEIVRLLLEAGADITAKTNRGESVFDLAKDTSIKDDREEDIPELLNLLRSHWKSDKPHEEGKVHAPRARETVQPKTETHR